MQNNKKIEEVFMKYSKPVIIQWLCTQYPVFFKDKKEIIRELNDCKDFISHNNGTVEFTEYRDSQSIWNEENIDLKTHYEEIIDLSDNHILSVEEIKAHSYKDIRGDEK